MVAISISIQITLASGGVGWLMSRAIKFYPQFLVDFQLVRLLHTQRLFGKAQRILLGLSGRKLFPVPTLGRHCMWRMSAQHQDPDHPRWTLQSRHSSPLDALGPTQPESAPSDHTARGKSWAHTRAASRPFLTTVSLSGRGFWGWTITCPLARAEQAKTTGACLLCPHFCVSVSPCVNWGLQVWNYHLLWLWA